MRDTINFALLALDVDPVTANLDQVAQAAQKLTQQRDDGIVRAYYGNDYIDQLAGGNLALTMAWSGDVNFLKVDNPDLEFVVPDEGGTGGRNMAIPPPGGEPRVQPMSDRLCVRRRGGHGITEWVWYESPVAGYADLIREHAQEDDSLTAVAERDLVWPTAEVLAKTFPYKNLTLEEAEAWHSSSIRSSRGRSAVQAVEARSGLTPAAVAVALPPDAARCGLAARLLPFRPSRFSSPPEGSLSPGTR